MKKIRGRNLLLGLFILASFGIKLALILKYGNSLTLSSDDLNYVKSAVVLIKKGILTYYGYTEPTVFIMPLYTLFLAAVFITAGYGFAGLQAVRVIQALFSCVSILLVYRIAARQFDAKTALAAAFLVAFYMPNITTAGYMLTETLFTMLLLLLIHLSLKLADRPGAAGFAVLGAVWLLATFCRPTVALYPVFYFFYLAVYKKYRIRALIKPGAAMLSVFILLSFPWWMRNYREYGDYIPLSASGGNPMLQGTYVDYVQTPENTTYYKLGRNTYETNKVEVETARKRIAEEFGRDFWGYLRWYTLGKSYYFWFTVFYWKQFFGIGHHMVLVCHYLLLAGFAGIFMLLFRKPLKHVLLLSVMLYFNTVHCVFMAFDRYAFPVMPLLAVFCAFFLTETIRAAAGVLRAGAYG